ncbi:hypothetical protein [Sphingomonas sp. ABOLG]|uniref:hypothetical protein n=1 Tax=Sphingomonas sp. ABOLG TaxID=1985880 RepID=UPI0010022C05|nr:hypothetical protein [Sphingomonas sp. ABOLG]RSV19240.1 hypothetical protein CA236_04120 [Sphingomonas sp. ABOLG]
MIMAFRDNSVLISTAAAQDVAADNSDGIFNGADGANAFVIASGNVGDDTFLNFGSDDSIITGRQIFDGNNDGFIAFGPNGVLDVNRTGGGARRAGNDQLQVVGENGVDITEIRYLGTKGGNFAYADSATLRQLNTTFGADNVMEGDVSDDVIDMSDGAKVLLHDNGLGLNLGSDVVNGFGSDDLFVTTSKLFDRTGNDIVTFGGNDVLDTSGAEGPMSSDPSTGPGGQVDFTGIDGLAFLGETVGANGVTYYYYGTTDTTVDPFAG